MSGGLGAHGKAEAVVRAALDRLRQDDLRTRRYRTLVQEGLDDLAAGRSETVEDIDAWLGERGRQPP